MDTIEKVKESLEVKDSHNGKKIQLGLMPGSRPKELVRHIPIMMECLTQLKKNFPNLEASLFAVDFVQDSFYRSLISDFISSKKQNESIDPNSIQLIRETDCKKRIGLTLSLTASGTATLENALLGIPMVVMYKASWLTFTIAKFLIQVPFVSMPNILFGKMVIPELIQSNATSKLIIQSANNLLSDPSSLEKIRDKLTQLRKLLGPPGAYGRTAKIIFDLI
jgi:lipid-A-disaccharide synthase